jgi:hypothetical protein
MRRGLVLYVIRNSSKSACVKRKLRESILVQRTRFWVINARSFLRLIPSFSAASTRSYPARFDSAAEADSSPLGTGASRMIIHGWMLTVILSEFCFHTSLEREPFYWEGVSNPYAHLPGLRSAAFRGARKTRQPRPPGRIPQRLIWRGNFRGSSPRSVLRPYQRNP